MANNLFVDPFAQQQQLSAIQQNMMRLQGAGVQPPANRPNPLANAFLTVMDILDRGRNSVVTGLNQFLDTGSLAAGGRGLWQGLTGKTRTSGSDLLSTIGIENPLLKSIGGFVTDVALDPTTWLGGVGLLTRPATAAASSAFRGAAATGLERAGVAGAKEALEKTTMKYGRELADVVLRSLNASDDNVAKAIANEALKQAANRGFSKAAAQQFITDVVTQSTKQAISPSDISKLSKAYARQLDNSGSKVAQVLFNTGRESLQPLDVVGNRLANIISKPAAAFGERVGSLGNGSVGRAAVDFADWAGHTFNRNYVSLAPAGLGNYLGNVRSAQALLDTISSNEEFRSILAQYPDIVDNPEPYISKLSKDQVSMLQNYRQALDMTSGNPYEVYRQRYGETPIKLLEESRKKMNTAASDIRSSLKRSPLASLPRESAEQLADVIESPLNYMNDVISANSANWQLNNFTKDNPELISKLNAANMPLGAAAANAKDLVRQGIINDSDARKLTQYNKWLQDINNYGQYIDSSIPPEAFNIARKAMLTEKDYNDLIERVATATQPNEVDIAALMLVRNADDMFEQARQQLSPEMQTALDSYMESMRNLADKYELPLEERRRYYVPHQYLNPPTSNITYVGKNTEINRALKESVPFLEERNIETLRQAEKLGYKPVKDLLALQNMYEKKMAQRDIKNQLFNSLKAYGLVAQADDGLPAGEWVKDYKYYDEAGKQNYAIHKETYNLLKEFDNITESPKEIKNFWKSVDKVVNIWKTSVTSLRPSWQIQNVLGNTFNNYLTGLRDPSRYVAAKNLVEGKASEVTKYLKEHGLNETADSVMKKFQHEVGEGFGRTLGDVNLDSALEEAAELRVGRRATAPQLIGEALQQPGIKGKVQGLVAASRDIGDAVETNAKLALFIDRLIKGDTPEKAGQVVKAALFDYTDITQAEKAIRRVVPFYTFTRKNLPYQLSKLLYDPNAMRTIRKVQTNLADAFGIETEDMPDYVATSAFPISPNAYINASLPWETLSMIGNPRQLASMISPALRTPIELATNRQMFSDRNIVRYPSQGVTAGNISDILQYLAGQFGVNRDIASITGAMAGTPAATRSATASVTPALGAQSENPLVRALGAAIKPVVRGYNQENAQKYADYNYNKRLADLIRVLQENGIEVPTLNELEGGF